MKGIEMNLVEAFFNFKNAHSYKCYEHRCGVWSDHYVDEITVYELEQINDELARELLGRPCRKKVRVSTWKLHTHQIMAYLIVEGKEVLILNACGYPTLLTRSRIGSVLWKLRIRRNMDIYTWLTKDKLFIGFNGRLYDITDNNNILCIDLTDRRVLRLASGKVPYLPYWKYSFNRKKKYYVGEDYIALKINGEKYLLLMNTCEIFKLVERKLWRKIIDNDYGKTYNEIVNFIKTKVRKSERREVLRKIENALNLGLDELMVSINDTINSMRLITCQPSLR